MPPAAFPSNEAARLDALKRAEVLDTPLEPHYDSVATLAAFITKAPIALISLVDKDRQWFKARHNFDVCETARDHAFCSYVVQLGIPVLTLDASQDARFFDNPLVLGPPGIRFYAGSPIFVPGTDLCLGTVCVIDTKPWDDFSSESVQALSLLAQQVGEMMHLNIKLSLERQMMYHFVSKVSHELRTPVHGVLGLAENLAQQLGNVGADCREMLSAIISTAKQNLQVVNSVMEFAKLQRGPFASEGKIVNLREFIEGLFPLLHAGQGSNAIEVGYEMMQDVEVKIDTTQLTLALVHLMDNAIKFTNAGSARLTVTVDDVTDDFEVETVRFIVHDTGIGIDPSNAHKLFQPFSQIDDSATRSYGGCGLGLAISRRVVEAMGGELWVDSVEGGGSKFGFSLDLPARRLHSRNSFPQKRALIINSSAHCSFLLEKHCQSLALQVERAANIAHAYSALSHYPGDYDVVFFQVNSSDELHSLPSIDVPYILVGNRVQLESFQPVMESAAPAFTLPYPIMQSQLEQGLVKLWHSTAVHTPPSPILPEFSALHVAVVDDNAINRRVLAQFLKNLGCLCNQFVNGQEVVDSAKDHPYDVVFMDIEMPVLDGIVATSILRQEQLATYVAAVTANASPELRQKCFSVGVDEFLEKPVRMDDIRTCLTSSLRTHSSFNHNPQTSMNFLFSSISPSCRTPRHMSFIRLATAEEQPRCSIRSKLPTTLPLTLRPEPPHLPEPGKGEQRNRAPRRTPLRHIFSVVPKIFGTHGSNDPSC